MYPPDSPAAPAGLPQAPQLPAQGNTQDPNANPLAKPIGPAIDTEKIIGEVNQKFDRWRQMRRPSEVGWFLNAAFRQGYQAFAPEPLRNRVRKDPDSSLAKELMPVNRIFPKARTRLAKFTKTRPKPVIIPFRTERKDKLDARATQRTLDYIWDKRGLERKYQQAILWAADCSKGYWIIHWDDDLLVPVKLQDPVSGQPTVQDAVAGDVDIEVPSPFEIFVKDPKIARIADQYEVMRVRQISVDDAKKRFPSIANDIVPDSAVREVFEYEKRMSNLSSRGFLWPAQEASSGDENDQVSIKELFTRPCAKYPKGRYVVICGSQMARYQEQLPYGFEDLENPFPIVEFVDLPCVGRFWGPTLIEQLIPIQRAYNKLRTQVERHLHKNVHSKWTVPVQAQIPDGALTNDAAEVVEWNFIPGMPGPQPVQPAPISADVWRVLQLLRQEMDDVSQVFPSAEGKIGGATSGFQTNLLQEATDEVITPEARGFELAVEEAMIKCRRVMKQGYDVPRLISVTGPNYRPEIFEFHGGQIDEHASIKVQIGSALSGYKATKINQILDLHQRGLFGDPNDPEVKRRVLSLLEMGDLEEAQEMAQRDEDLARLENDQLFDQPKLLVPQWYEDHRIHYQIHTDELKSVETQDWTPDQLNALKAHAILHLKYLNPAAAFIATREANLPQLVQMGLVPQPPGAPMPQPGQPPHPVMPGQPPQGVGPIQAGPVTMQTGPVTMQPPMPAPPQAA